ncbi:MAG: hypothetical protein HQ462_05150 [Deltaproteobacteria bacterium]|nr:hypothetical protein [Deltaproteobacteria bacterium]
MKGQFLIASRTPPTERDIYADKSALVLAWLLRADSVNRDFSLREVAGATGASLGLVQAVLEALVRDGCLVTVGLRTAKRFRLKDSRTILKSWTERYSIVKKCKMWNYRSALKNRLELIDVLKRSNFHKKTALALHSAADVLGFKNTNLQTLELYLLDPKIKTGLEKKLELEPQERGYEVLLIRPFYKSILAKEAEATKSAPLLKSPALLTFLDLYNFPLRGREQADFMAERVPELKKIHKKG